MNRRTTVYVYGEDPISQAGVAAQLRGRPETTVVDADAVDDAEVAIIVVGTIDEAALRVVRGIQRGGCPKVVLVVGEVDNAGLLLAAQARVSGIIRRRYATSDELARAVVAAVQGDGTWAPDLVTRLIDQVSRLHDQVLVPRGLRGDGLNEREHEVLKLLVDGRATSEIAEQLAYSERTIKSIIGDVRSRYQLRNRSHVVAFALKNGIV